MIIKVGLFLVYINIIGGIHKNKSDLIFQNYKKKIEELIKMSPDITIQYYKSEIAIPCIFKLEQLTLEELEQKAREIHGLDDVFLLFTKKCVQINKDYLKSIKSSHNKNLNLYIIDQQEIPTGKKKVYAPVTQRNKETIKKMLELKKSKINKINKNNKMKKKIKNKTKKRN